MKLNNRKNIVLGSILSVALIISGCANKKTHEGSAEDHHAGVSPYDHSVYTSSQADEHALQHNTVHFNFDSSAILDADYPYLDAYVAYYTSDEGKDEQLVVYGHTDQVGTRSYNLALGERRANAVKDYLVKKGIEAFRIEVVSYGFEKPVMPGFTKEACAANRRVQITKR
jgi:peptidoglycan-associated lipoprotein